MATGIILQFVEAGPKGGEAGGEGGASGGEGNGSDDGEERPNSMERASSGDGSNDGANQQVDEPGRKGKSASAEACLQHVKRDGRIFETPFGSKKGAVLLHSFHERNVVHISPRVPVSLAVPHGRSVQYQVIN